MSQSTTFVTTNEIESLTRQVLETHQLYCLPVNPVDVALAEGIPVFQADLGNTVSGIMRRQNGQFRIYVNRTTSIRRKRFTIAHELGHYFLHRDLLSTFVDPEINLFRYNDRDAYANGSDQRREIQANLFAASLLMPEEFVRIECERTQDIDELASAFGVSEDAMGYRIVNLGLA